MNTPATDTVVRSSIVVEGPIDQAFSVFTDGIGTWFPPEYNILGVDIAERVFEPRVGELANGLRAIRQPLEDRPARRVAERRPAIDLDIVSLH